MYSQMTRLVDVLDDDGLRADQVIGWSCPVPFFGHLESARVATVGINPSNREFVGLDGEELGIGEQRLPTLRSLGLESWGEADFTALRGILAACRNYFERNPYDGWFGALQRIIAGTGRSYYSPTSDACHLDIVPWATATKWGTLLPAARKRLVLRAAAALETMISGSPIAMLVLNGQEVVRQFEALTGQQFTVTFQPAWDLPRKSGRPVIGLAYTMTMDQLAGVPLQRPVAVIGYNHNLQSSFGVTTHARHAIRDWITDQHDSLPW